MINRTILPNAKRRTAQKGFGLMLLVMLVASALVTITTLQMSMGNLGVLRGSQKDWIVAKQVAASGLVYAQQDIQAKLDAGTAVNTAYRFPTTPGTFNNITVANDPNNLAGATSAVGSYYATVTQTRGNSYLVKVVATVGSAIYTKSQLFLMADTIDNPKLFARFTGRDYNDYAGSAVSNAGDVNGDGYVDFLIGAYCADGGGANSGETYLLMGRSQDDWDSLSNTSGNFSLLNTSKANKTVRFLGRAAGDFLGFSVSSAGDVNGDGYADLIIGAYNASGGGSTNGECYLVMGRSQTDWDTLTDASGNFSLLNTSKTNKTVRFLGRASADSAGYTLSRAGDVNGDGYADLLVGASWADGGGSDSGESYLIMGRSQTDWDTLSDASGNFALTSLSKANKTVRFLGRAADDHAGDWGNSAGDVNGDGYADLIINASSADGGGSDNGEAYLIMGRSQTDWDTLTDASGNFSLLNTSKANKTVRFLGRANSDSAASSVSSAGDINADGYADLLIGALRADGGGGNNGEVYLVMGRSQAAWDTLADASGNVSLLTISLY